MRRRLIISGRLAGLIKLLKRDAVLGCHAEVTELLRMVASVFRV